MQGLGLFRKSIVMINLGIGTGQYCMCVKNTDGDNSRLFCFWAFLSLPKNFKLPEKLFTDQNHAFGNSFQQSLHVAFINYVKLS